MELYKTYLCYLAAVVFTILGLISFMNWSNLRAQYITQQTMGELWYLQAFAFWAFAILFFVIAGPTRDDKKNNKPSE